MKKLKINNNILINKEKNINKNENIEEIMINNMNVEKRLDDKIIFKKNPEKIIQINEK